MAEIVTTIGHSNHPIARFLELLGAHQVQMLCDVRSVPHSRRHPQFGRDALARALKEAGIEYLYLGRELGGRSQMSYERVAKTALFQQGIARVAQEASARRLALMCAEKEPLDCHRALLVSRHLVTAGVAVEHILADGKREPHDETIARLIRDLGIPGPDLLRSMADVVEEAYRVREGGWG